MLTTTTRFFQSTDAGAPSNLGVAGGFITVLKACLVGTGGIAYGSKPSAGWTLVWEDVGTNVAVFRNNTNYGNGAYIRVDDSNATAAQIIAYELMTDINNGVRPTSVRWMQKCASASVPQPWQIVGDQRTFYGQFWRSAVRRPAQPDASMNTSVFGGGDFIRLDGRPGVFVTGKVSNNPSADDYFGFNGASSEAQCSITITRNNKQVRTSGSTLCVGTWIPGPLANVNSGAAPSSATLWIRPGLCTQSYPYSIIGYLRGIWIPLSYPFTGDEPAGTILTPYMTNQFGRLVSLVGTGSNSNTTNWLVGAEIDRSWDTEV